MLLNLTAQEIVRTTQLLEEIRSTIVYKVKVGSNYDLIIGYTMERLELIQKVIANSVVNEYKKERCLFHINKIKSKVCEIKKTILRKRATGKHSDYPLSIRSLENHLKVFKWMLKDNMDSCFDMTGESFEVNPHPCAVYVYGYSSDAWMAPFSANIGPSTKKQGFKAVFIDNELWVKNQPKELWREETSDLCNNMPMKVAKFQPPVSAIRFCKEK